MVFKTNRGASVVDVSIKKKTPIVVQQAWFDLIITN